jgi:hypothetical protein
VLLKLVRCWLAAAVIAVHGSGSEDHASLDPSYHVHGIARAIPIGLHELLKIPRLGCQIDVVVLRLEMVSLDGVESVDIFLFR